MSTPARIVDQFGRPMSVQDGTVLPANASGLLKAGVDENNQGRVATVDSKFNADVTIDALTYGARFSPINGAFTAGAPMYTRTVNGQVATSAVTTVKIAQSGSTMGMFFAASAATTTFVVVSTSANDTAAGTGIRTINIIYIGRDGLRYLTSATMNGTTPVTVNLTVAAVGVDQVYSTSAGTGGVAAGVITVKNTGSVTTMGQINTGNTYVVTTEQLVQTNKTVYLCSVRASAQTTATRIGVVYYSYDYTTGSVSGAQQLDIERFRVSASSVQVIVFNPPISFRVPNGYVGRLWMTTTPDAVTASNYWGAMDTFECAST